MANSGLAIFVIFFGVSLLDAFAGGHWVRAACWLAIGGLFWALARSRPGRRDKSNAAAGDSR
ncbi:MAG TPA: hypothetical protein VGP80_09245 [Gemmatimonadales bacterium]|jgi:hypothetical protein|nr:hypothetical protein [Gemmatimonadales bacterium]